MGRAPRGGVAPPVLPCAVASSTLFRPPSAGGGVIPRPPRGLPPAQSHSSVGQSATLIMWRSAVQLCLGLRSRGISSVGSERLPCTQEAKGSSPLSSTRPGGGAAVRQDPAPARVSAPAGRSPAPSRKGGRGGERSLTSWKDEEEAGGGACRAAGKQATARARGRVPRRAMEKKRRSESRADGGCLGFGRRRRT